MLTFDQFINEQKETLEFKIEKAKFDFIFNVKKSMLDQNMTQAELAEKIGTSKAYISKVLQGDSTNFTIESMVKICFALGGDLETRILINNFYIDKNSRYNHEKTRWISDGLINGSSNSSNRIVVRFTQSNKEAWRCSQY